MSIFRPILVSPISYPCPFVIFASVFGKMALGKGGKGWNGGLYCGCEEEARDSVNKAKPTSTLLLSCMPGIDCMR